MKLEFYLMNDLHNINPNYKSQCWSLLEKLFPIYRSLLGEGFKESLNIISEIIPISIIDYPSKSKCGSWTIPDEWILKDAYIKNSKGEIILNHQDNQFHVWQYSIPFSGLISREELERHIFINKNNDRGISHRVTYYTNNWGFSLSRNQFNSLDDDNYFVEINSEFRKGALTTGELYLKGKKDDEIIIDAVLSSPSLANNLSGVIVLVFLAEMISHIKERKFSYRILFTAETIGPIALHYLKKNFGKKVVGGFNLINLAYGKKFNYKLSRRGNTIADKAMEHSLKHFDVEYDIRDYDVLTGTCGNEKAYNSLGLEIPIGSLHRSPLGSYPEYDTDQDNLNFIDQEQMFQSLKVSWGAIQTLERSEFYKHNFEGEPFLTGYGLFPKIKNDTDRIPYDYLMAYTDGNLSLIDIADKAGVPITYFDQAVFEMLDKDLINEL